MKRAINLLDGEILPSLRALAIPIMASSLIQMAYNLTDMIWIGRIGSDAVAAIGAAGMFMWLSNGLVTLAKMGSQIKIGQSLGQDDRMLASRYAHSALLLGIFFAFVFAMICIFFGKQMILFFQLNSAQVIADAHHYLLITCGLVIFSFLNQVFTGIFTAMGNSRTTFQATAIGLVLNILLDPLLIFGFGAIPALHVIGAAIATIFAQAVVTLLLFSAARKDDLLFPLVHLFSRPDPQTIREILRLGFPTAIQSMLFSAISMVVARLIAGWGDGAIAVQKVGSQIESISWMSAEGYGAALNTFTAQNYGAGNARRIEQGFMLSLKVMMSWGIFTTLLLLLFPSFIFRFFINEAQLLPLGVDYLRILGLSQAFMCLEYTAASIWNGLGHTFPPSLVSITLTASRIPLAIFLSHWLGLNGFWWAMTITSFGKGTVLFLWLIKKKKEPYFFLKQPL